MKWLDSVYELGPTKLKNRIVMAPMTRCRAPGGVPGDLVKTYYTQRAEAGLIITEGTAPSAKGLGYARIPGLFTKAQHDGWKIVTESVHASDASIFVQLMHTGRVSHPDNMTAGSQILAPSSVPLEGTMWTDQKGLQPYPTPKAMTLDDLRTTREEYVHAALLAMEAGFDGVELHGANGYLLDQFLNIASNRRTDEYGGPFSNRARFVLEVAEAVSKAIGAQRVGIRLSPYGVFNGMTHWPEIHEDYVTLAKNLGKLHLVYLHLVDHSSMGAPVVVEATKQAMRIAFGGTLILSGGYTAERAEADIERGAGHLVAFGRPFISNPDLVSRMRRGAPLEGVDPTTFYTPDEKGYTDYPMLG